MRDYSVDQLVDLYLALDSLPHAEQAFTLREALNRPYSLRRFALYLIAKKDLTGFDRYLTQIREAILASNSPVDDYRVFIDLAESLHTNNFPAQAKSLFLEATRLVNLDSLPKLVTSKPPSNDTDFNADWAVSLRLRALSEIAVAEHYCAFTSDALQLLKELESLPRKLPRKYSSECRSHVFDLALSLGEFDTAEKMLRQFPRKDRTFLVRSIAEAEARFGKLADAVGRLEKLRDKETVDHTLFEIAIVYANAHQFESAESVSARISSQDLRDALVHQFFFNYLRANRPGNASACLDQITNQQERILLSEQLSQIRPGSPVPLLPRPLNGQRPFCGTTLVAADSFLRQVNKNPEKIVAEIKLISERPGFKSRSYATLQSVGRALSYGHANDQSIEFWKSKYPDPLSLAHLYLGLAEGQTLESFTLARWVD